MSGRAPKPACVAVRTWLKLNGLSLAPLTGTDVKALSAAVHILELYAYSGDVAALAAFRTVVLQMQPKTREYAYHAIALAMDWDDRPRVWALAGLVVLDARHVCAGEPGGAARRAIA